MTFFELGDNGELVWDSPCLQCQIGLLTLLSALAKIMMKKLAYQCKHLSRYKTWLK